jgi:hypothetical protein
MRPRCQAKNKHPSLRIPKSGNRFSPVFMIAIGAPLFARNLLAIYHQSRTPRAADDLSVKNIEPCGSGHLSLIIFGLK